MYSPIKIFLKRNRIVRKCRHILSPACDFFNPPTVPQRSTVATAASFQQRPDKADPSSLCTGFCQKLNEEQKTSRLVPATSENYSFMPSNFGVTRLNRDIMQFSVEMALAILINEDVSKEPIHVGVSSAAACRFLKNRLIIAGCVVAPRTIVLVNTIYTLIFNRCSLRN